MKRWKGLKYALEWIANNDEPEELNPDVIATQVSVLLIADCTGHNENDLAKSIIAIRMNK